MTYSRRVEIRMWDDEKFRRLSPLQPCGQGLWIYLLIGPHTGPVPGLFRAGRAAMAEELGWSLECFDKAFQEISSRGMAEADFDARLIWLPNAIKYNRPKNPHMVRAWRRQLESLSDCNLKFRAINVLRETLRTIDPSYLAAFVEIVGEAPRGTTGGQP